MAVRFHPEADAEFHEALEWYAHQRVGLDAEFMRCVDVLMARIERHPQQFPVILRGVRRALVKRFPYAIFFEANEREIMILAVFHVRRNPDVWKARLSGKPM